MSEYVCGNCGFEGHCYGIPTGDGVSAPSCSQCGINSKLTPLKAKTISNTMPEEIWLNSVNADVIKSAWKKPDKVHEKMCVPYLLKSTTDAERAADSKTISTLAEALEKIKAFEGKRGYITEIATEALSDNATRIAEAFPERDISSDKPPVDGDNLPSGKAQEEKK